MTRRPGLAPRLLLGGLLSVAAIFVVASAASASQIAWSQFSADGSSARIVAASSNSDGFHRVTQYERHVVDLDPVISPDGSRVAFERDVGETARIGLIDINGTNEQLLDLDCVDPCAVDLMPSWLPGGSRIAFTPVIGPFDGPNESAAQAVLHTATLDGSDVRRLSPPGIDGRLEDYHARYSPDGSYLVFVRVRNADLHVAIFRMDADGTDVRRLTPWRLDADLADISPATNGPTADLIVFETYGMGAPEGKNSNLATIPATCLTVAKCRDRIRYVTHHRNGSRESFNPSWAPDGKRVAFVRFTNRGKKLPPFGDIWTIRPDGSGARQVSTSSAFEFRPDWGVG